MMFALVAMFDLELRQLGLVNAFLNSKLDEVNTEQLFREVLAEPGSAGSYLKRHLKFHFAKSCVL